MSKLQSLIQRLCPEGVEYRKLGAICHIEKGKTPIQKATPGEFPLVVTANERLWCDSYQFDCTAVCIPLISSSGHGKKDLRTIHYQSGKFALGNILCAVIPNNERYISAQFLYVYLLARKDFLIVPLMRGGANVSLSTDSLKNIKVPVPPLEVQQEIVQILDQFTQLTAELTAELTARRKQFTFYQTALFQQAQNATVKYLDEISENCDNLRKPVTSGNRTKGDYPYYGASGIVDYVDNYIFDGDYLLVSEDGANLLARSTPIAFSITGKNWVNNHAHVLHFEEYATRRYVEFYLNAMDLSPYVTGGAQPKLNQKNLNRIPISLPSLPEQRRIVSILDRFDALCNDLTSGLPAEIAARQKQYEYYRDKLLTFKKLEE